MTISSTYDHRVIQGAESGAFLRRVDALLQGADGFYETIGGSLGVSLPDLPAAPSAATSPAPIAGPDGPAVTVSAADLGRMASAMALIDAYRSLWPSRGHASTRSAPAPSATPRSIRSPLASTRRPWLGSRADLLRIHVPGATLAEALPALRETYCGSIAYEVEHIASHDERVWLRQAIESGAHRTPLTAQSSARCSSG